MVDLLSATAMAVVLGYGGLRVLDGEMTAGGLFVFIALLVNFFEPVQQLSQFYQTFSGQRGRLDKIFDVIETPAGMPDRPDAGELEEIGGRWPSSTSLRIRRGTPWC